ncbi:hypothetical protein [Naasia sp. SYSU D00948]|uniref:hypothetical protein n=1 Tax=Naasia sp. SYSU D00948 TaxID=2817379 RepID=UPI001B308FAC|nr:hypothetical protein [Naasia sp. SYSU D00948]
MNDNAEHQGNGQQAPGQLDEQQVLAKIAELSTSIHELAMRLPPLLPGDGAADQPSGRMAAVARDDSEEERRRLERQRVDFAYRSLGALMGRNPAARGFDLSIFAARWDDDEIELIRLPALVDRVEVHAPAFTTKEGRSLPAFRRSLKVLRDAPSKKDQSDRKRPARVRLERHEELVSERPIDVLIGLDQTGQRVALGPRLAPSSQYIYAS